MIQPIVLFNPASTMLREVIPPVDIESEREQAEALIQDLKDTLEWVGGLGLAANQIAVRKRVCVVKFGPNEIVPMVNPEIVWHDGVEHDSEEACLSFPDLVMAVKRWSNIRVKFIDPETWTEREMEVEYPNSVIPQHEIDHLDGKTIIDNITPMQRTLIANKLKRITRGTVPIDYVGLTWKPSGKTWQVVGSQRKLMELHMYRMKMLAAAAALYKQSGEGDGITIEGNEEPEARLEAEENTSGTFQEHEAK